MLMIDYTKVESLRQKLIDERRKTIMLAAESGVLPPRGCLAFLSDLDTTIIAVEAMLQERTGLGSLADEIGNASLDAIVA